MITSLRFWLARKLLGVPEFHCRDEAERLYKRIWPKHIATKDATLRIIAIFMMKQRINERIEARIRRGRL